MEIIVIFLIGVSLSLDAFSLAVGYGALNISEKKIKQLTIIVGLFHFVMPQLGMLCGHIINDYIVLNTKLVVSLIFFIIGITMLFEKKKESKVSFVLNGIGMFLFGLSVSIDSFTAGIGIEFISNKHLLCSFIFSITSAIFTYMGLKIGKKINEVFKNLSPIIGGVLLIIFSFFFLIK